MYNSRLRAQFRKTGDELPLISLFDAKFLSGKDGWHSPALEAVSSLAETEIKKLAPEHLELLKYFGLEDCKGVPPPISKDGKSTLPVLVSLGIKAIHLLPPCSYLNDIQEQVHAVFRSINWAAQKSLGVIYADGLPSGVEPTGMDVGHMAPHLSPNNPFGSCSIYRKHLALYTRNGGFALLTIPQAEDLGRYLRSNPELLQNLCDELARPERVSLRFLGSYTPNGSLEEILHGLSTNTYERFDTGATVVHSILQALSWDIRELVHSSVISVVTEKLGSDFRPIFNPCYWSEPGV
jgi:hypothetical protein